MTNIKLIAFGFIPFLIGWAVGEYNAFASELKEIDAAVEQLKDNNNRIMYIK